MTPTCQGCVCSAPARALPAGRLVLSTRVDHTATALRSLALRRGSRLVSRAPGLLELRDADVDGFLAAARDALSSVEADEVRCLALDDDAGSEAGVLQRAMAAPTLAAAAARRDHADLLPLFDDEAGRFHAVYQPIVDLQGGGVVGHEALLRATDPAGAEVLPARLFPAAAAAGWTHLLDRVGRTTALRDAGPWLGDDALFINFVPTSIYRPEVCLRTTEQAARDAGLRLEQLVFEVTETDRVADLDHLASVFAHYRERGCRVALDDLGAGWSSLTVLVRLRPDVVKLDKELVQGLPGPVSRAVVQAVVDIAHSYGGTVLAECVETQEQADAARELGVDLGQGWFFGRPVRPAVTERAGAPAQRRAGAAARRDQAAAERPGEAAADRAPAERVDPTAPDAAVAVRPTVPAQPGPPASVVDEALLARAVEASASGVVVCDMLAPDAPVRYVNAAFEAMTGYAGAELLGRNLRLLQGPDTDPDVVAGIGAALRAGVEHRCVVRNHRRDGSAWWNELQLSPVRDDAGRLTHYLGFQHDVSDRVEAERLLAHHAAHDALTGLANRATLTTRLDGAVDRAQRTDRAVAVLFCDLDGFKQVNDRHGHAVGDAVLREVASRLRAALRGDDVLARTGGDEFVAVLADLHPADAQRVADRAAAALVEAVARPVAVVGVTARLSVSVGTAVLPGTGQTGGDLLVAADRAMYAVKQARAVAPR